MTKLEQMQERAIEKFEKDHRLEDGRLADIGFNGKTTEDFINSLITEVWNEAIKECEGCVRKKVSMGGEYEDYENGYEMGHNSCREQTLQAISKLRV